MSLCVVAIEMAINSFTAEYAKSEISWLEYYNNIYKNHKYYCISSEYSI